MKKIIAFLIATLMLNPCILVRADLVQSSCLYELMGLSSIDEIKQGVLVFEDEKSAVLSTEDMKQLITLHWDAGSSLFIQPYDAHENKVYVNFHTKDGGFTIYSYGSDILVGSFGKFNNIWYFTNMGSRRNAIRQKYEELYQKYSSQAKEANEPPIIPKINYLNLPQHDWAIGEVEDAADSNILPYEIANNYESNISRLDFCNLITQMIGEITTPGIASNRINVVDIFDELRGNDNAQYETVNFEDFDSTPDNINLLVQLGVLTGRGNNIFDPDSNITREETSKILCNTTKLFKDFPSQHVQFSDNNKISLWAVPFVDCVVSNRIINGIGNQTFDPQGEYTREQAISIIMRLYRLIVTSF